MYLKEFENQLKQNSDTIELAAHLSNIEAAPIYYAMGITLSIWIIYMYMN